MTVQTAGDGGVNVVVTVVPDKDLKPPVGAGYLRCPGAALLLCSSHSWRTLAL